MYGTLKVVSEQEETVSEVNLLYYLKKGSFDIFLMKI